MKRAHQAADWQQFMQEADVLPNLKWMPSTSPNPGADHMPFWGTILPIDDPFWDQHRPGDRWNCKKRKTTSDPKAPRPGQIGCCKDTTNFQTTKQYERKNQDMDFQHPYEARHQTRRQTRKQAKTNQRNAGILPLKGIKQRKKPLPLWGFRCQVRQNFKKKK